MTSLYKHLSVLAAVLTAVAVASPAQPEVGADIWGGTVSKPGAFPFIVALTLNGTIFCDGVLLNAYTMLTAAHCTPTPEDNVDLAWFSVYAGSVDLEQGGVSAGVSSFLIHPDWDPTTDNNDIGLWRLSKPLNKSPSVSYAALPPQNFDPPAAALVAVAGWGSTKESPDQSPRYLHEITYAVGSRADCVARFAAGKAPYFPETMFCAGSRQGQSGACDGDSGGPAVDAKSRVLWGLVAYGPRNCGAVNHYDAYVRVRHFVDWIDRNKFTS